MRSSRLTPQGKLAGLSGFLATWFLLLPGSLAWGNCSVDRGSGGPAAPLTRHLGRDCTEQERMAEAISADEILAALKAGRAVDLDRAVVVGDLSLDQVPPLARPISGKLRSLPSRIQETVQTLGLRDARLIAGPVAIRDSLVKGAIKTNIKAGLIAIEGPVTLTGTTFEQTFDLSRVAFGAPVDASRATWLKEAFFIHAWFAQGARFEASVFGVHSRFHKATFMGPATFHGADFNGLAEFLEVQFERDARFSQARFRLGTGFSGSRFWNLADFSDARFDREAFFTFTVFAKDATFRRTTFGTVTDFSDAEFRGVDEFSEAVFPSDPRFTRAKQSVPRPKSQIWQDPRLIYAVVAGLILLGALFMLAGRRAS